MAAMTGFAGLGLMGEPMALNLVRAATPLIVWNRTASKSESLRAAGALVAASLDELFERSSTIILMLSDGSAVDDVLARNTGAFAQRVAGRTIVFMGTEAPAYSQSLEKAVRDAGGSYVEAPVSGSRIPAQERALVAMLAGEPSTVGRVQPLIASMCRTSHPCGPVPNALLMKLAVNSFLIATVAGLAEACHFAESNGLDLEAFRAILDAGPMASAVSRAKLPKLLARNFEAQAAIGDVVKNTQLITAAASERQIASPILRLCRELFEETLDLGEDGADMSAVLCAIEARTRLRKRA